MFHSHYEILLVNFAILSTAKTSASTFLSYLIGSFWVCVYLLSWTLSSRVWVQPLYSTCKRGFRDWTRFFFIHTTPAIIFGSLTPFHTKTVKGAVKWPEAFSQHRILSGCSHENISMENKLSMNLSILEIVYDRQTDKRPSTIKRYLTRSWKGIQYKIFILCFCLMADISSPRQRQRWLVFKTWCWHVSGGWFGKC